MDPNPNKPINDPRIETLKITDGTNHFVVTRKQAIHLNESVCLSDRYDAYVNICSDLYDFSVSKKEINYILVTHREWDFLINLLRKRSPHL
jgi:hypothetical protein